MNRTIFVILVLLGFFALTKSKPSKPWPPICKNDYVCDSMGPGYECVDGRCEALPTISKGEYKTKHSRLFRNRKSNLKKNSEAQNPKFYCLYIVLIQKQLCS